MGLEQINPADTAWILISTALVMLMTPGLAFFYGGLVNRKSILNTLMMSYVSLGAVALLWVFVGYSLSFGSGNQFIGDFSYLWLKNVGTAPQEGSTIPHILFMAFQMMFAIITPALISGAIVERMKFGAYVLFICLWSLVVYAPLCHWVWGGGFLASHGALDFAGGTVVHISAGVSALVAAIMIGPREKKTNTDEAHNVPFVLLGAAILWFGWFGFNAGSALAADGIAANALVTTTLAASAALCAWAILERYFDKKVSATGAAIGAVVGLVTITPAAGFVGPISAIAMGIIGSCCSFATIKNLKRFDLDDTLDVFACHGVGGIVGSILTGVFASRAINPAGFDGLIYGNTTLMMPQVIETLIGIAISVVGTWICLKVVALVTEIRVNGSKEDFDVRVHRENAYGKLVKSNT